MVVVVVLFLFVWGVVLFVLLSRLFLLCFSLLFLEGIALYCCCCLFMGDIN